MQAGGSNPRPALQSLQMPSTTHTFSKFKVGPNKARVIATASSPRTDAPGFVRIFKGEILNVISIEPHLLTCARPNGDYAIIRFASQKGLELVEPCH